MSLDRQLGTGRALSATLAWELILGSYAKTEDWSMGECLI